MKNLTSPFWIKFKGILFLLVGVMSGALLILEQPTLKVALLLALTVSPVLCLAFLRKLKPARDNVLVRGLKRLALGNLHLCLEHRGLALGVVGLLLAATAAALPFLGREFMPELEEGNIWLTATMTW